MNKIIKNTLDSIKGAQTISKNECDYVEKLEHTITRDFHTVLTELDGLSDRLKELLLRANKLNIEDKYLIDKASEKLKETAKFTKRMEKELSKKKRKSTKFRDLHSKYCLLSEAVKTKSLLKGYINQLNRYM